MKVLRMKEVFITLTCSHAGQYYVTVCLQSEVERD